jgi:hypothetical protein
MASGFAVKTATAATALAAATAKSILNAITGTRELNVCEFSVSFDGVTASAVPVLIELCNSTQATAGTPGTSPTPTPIRPATGGASIFTAAESYSAEPTVLVPVKHWLLTPNGGLLVIQFPLGREYNTGTNTGVGKGAVIRCTAPAIVNVRGYIEVEE